MDLGQVVFEIKMIKAQLLKNDGGLSLFFLLAVTVSNIYFAFSSHSKNRMTEALIHFFGGYSFDLKAMNVLL